MKICAYIDKKEIDKIELPEGDDVYELRTSLHIVGLEDDGRIQLDDEYMNSPDLDKPFTVGITLSKKEIVLLST